MLNLDLHRIRVTRRQKKAQTGIGKLKKTRRGKDSEELVNGLVMMGVIGDQDNATSSNLSELGFNFSDLA